MVAIRRMGIGTTQLKARKSAEQLGGEEDITEEEARKAVMPLKIGKVKVKDGLLIEMIKGGETVEWIQKVCLTAQKSVYVLGD